MTLENIKVLPTKSLFIYMLTRDVKLEKAIIDLIDNSIDAAINHSIEDDLSPFKIEINADENTFSIKDNCGGIDLKTARNYAFKFGRPDTVDKKVGNIGQFGIGMKRTIFKLGRKCYIESKSLESKFTLDLDIEEWKKEEEDWSFPLNTEISPDETSLSETYTNVIVTDLYQDVLDSFKVQNFINELRLEIEEAHAYNLAKGLQIYLNGDRLTYHVPQLKSTEEINILRQEFYFEEGTENEVKVTICAGLSDRELTDAGWYIYCNNRLLLSANQNMTTGWESNSIRKFHPDFAFFRGYVFFESENGDRLPWTTTKDGINFNSGIYQATLLEMQNTIKPILGFLTDLAKETTLFNKDPENIERKLHTEMEKLIYEGTSIDLKNITENQKFKAPVFDIQIPRMMGTISFSRPLEELSNMKRTYKLSSNKEVGEMTYFYFVENEME